MAKQEIKVSPGQEVCSYNLMSITLFISPPMSSHASLPHILHFFTGTKGMPGVPGHEGTHGLPGDPNKEKGFHGDPGAQGLPGIKGMPGITGYRGITGFEGMPGNTVSRAIIMS